MANTKSQEREPVRSLHVELPLSFHRKLKMLCAMSDSTMKKYALEAIEEKVARDEDKMRSSE